MQSFIFRNIKQNETDQVNTIEQICYPPNEACSEKSMVERIRAAEELYLEAEDTDAGLHDPQGKNIMLLGLDVLPEYQRQGLGRELVNRYLERERKNGRQVVFLTCLQQKVKMYEKFGFTDRGMANSTWGGEEWHEMSYTLF